MSSCASAPVDLEMGNVRGSEFQNIQLLGEGYDAVQHCWSARSSGSQRSLEVAVG